ncbi:hypothetical protein NPIL_2191 [Nephila pilipes]|uniref:Uncharacterized protein n=1 Tax=Nephila pilipes TaxID=299642 RepID=A0A8X6QFZ0_NEPPI|nr:hypothetical protein NPIL_2191 [Nephila pilipes]
MAQYTFHLRHKTSKPFARLADFASALECSLSSKPRHETQRKTSLKQPLLSCFNHLYSLSLFRLPDDQETRCYYLILDHCKTVSDLSVR